MAIKIVGAICGTCWAIFGISFLFPEAGSTGQEALGVFFNVAMGLGIFSLCALAIMALINYARRSR